MDLRRARRRLLPSRVNDRDYFSMEGGLNQADTPLRLRPGQLLACSNYEPGVRGGYTSMEGYERFDGRTAPSDASYWLLDYDGGSGPLPSAGDTVTGLTSGATGIVLTTVATDSATGTLVLARVTGTFANNEQLQESAVTFALANGVARIDAATTDETHEAYVLLTTEDARAQIQQVPGSGRLLGVAIYRGIGYAFRNNVGGTAALMYKSSASGWQLVPLGWTLAFDAGQAAGITEGATLTGATSGATGVVRRIVLQGGSFPANDAAGYLILTGVTGAFVDNENLQISASTRATANGASSANTLAPSGRYEFRVKNFYGHTSTLRLYGVSGTHKAFEYQDSPEFFCPIATGMTIDTPSHIAVHNDQLFLSFQGGSVQKSGVGDPTAWVGQIALGAGEMAIGDECTGFIEELGSSLFMFARNRTKVLLGKEGSYDLQDYNADSGAFPYMQQRIGQGVYLDDRGFSLLSTTQKFGNFSYNSFSDVVDKLVKQIKKLGTASVVARNKNLYRAFFSDGRVVSIGFNGRQVTGITTGSYERVVRCAESDEDPDGDEMILFGSDDGYVYRADKGTSFDGADITTFMRPVFHFSRSPSRRKRYRRAQFDVDTQGPCTIQIGIDLSFADPNEPGEPIKELPFDGGGGFWGSDNWGEFKWSTGIGSSPSIKVDSSGTNIGFLVASKSATQKPHTMQGVSLHHSKRRVERGTSG